MKPRSVRCKSEGFFLFWNSGSQRLQKFFHSLLKCPSEGKQKKERSGRFLELFKQFATQQKFTMTSAKLGAIQLTMKLVNASVFFNFPSVPLSLVYMQVPSSQERVSKNFERTLFKICLLETCNHTFHMLTAVKVNSRMPLDP